MSTTLEYFGLGAVGALAPEIVRLYSLAKSNDKYKFTPFYLIMSVVFAALGGLLAIVLPTENLQSALYAGIGTPLIISSVLKKATGQAESGQPQTNGEKKAAAPRAAHPSRMASFLAGI
jgi:hypothetical protein